MTTVTHIIETKEAIVTIENKKRFYKMSIELKNGYISLGYPTVWNRLKDAKAFVNNNYNN